MPSFITIDFVVQNRAIRWDWDRDEFSGLFARAEDVMWEVLADNGVENRTMGGTLLIPTDDSFDPVVTIDEAFHNYLDETWLVVPDG